jgi:hypothetical protein
MIDQLVPRISHEMFMVGGKRLGELFHTPNDLTERQLMARGKFDAVEQICRQPI